MIYATVLVVKSMIGYHVNERVPSFASGTIAVSCSKTLVRPIKICVRLSATPQIQKSAMSLEDAMAYCKA
jgi:hypothetical protein